MLWDRVNDLALIGGKEEGKGGGCAQEAMRKTWENCIFRRIKIIRKGSFVDDRD